VNRGPMPHANRDGLSLYYEQAGAGDRTFVFVHGWCCDHTFFRPQFDHFKTSSAVTTLDLRGCGKSDRPEDGYDIPTLADDLAWLCETLGISRPIVVGHSLGGMIGLELAARHPSIPEAIVAVDPGAIDLLARARSTYTGLASQLEGPHGDDVRRSYIEGMFLETDDVDRSRRIVEVMCSVPLSVAGAGIRGVVDWNGVGALLLCNVPVLVVLAQTGGSNDPARLRRLKPDIHIGMTVGAGHFNQLDAPEQVTAMIDRFLRVAT